MLMYHCILYLYYLHLRFQNALKISKHNCYLDLYITIWSTHTLADNVHAYREININITGVNYMSNTVDVL